VTKEEIVHIALVTLVVMGTILLAAFVLYGFLATFKHYLNKPGEIFQAALIVAIPTIFITTISRSKPENTVTTFLYNLAGWIAIPLLGILFVTMFKFFVNKKKERTKLGS
jgi:multisubunit Na+/H+ antiporter MnhB subunit